MILPADDAGDPDLSFITFGIETLGLPLYRWQEDVLAPFDDLATELVQVSLCTPNGSGKSSVVIPTLALGMLALYPRATVVISTADGRQLKNQILPAIYSHRAKFPHWKFIEKEITTPGPEGNYDAGGRLVAFTTDDAGRAEGWHKISNVEGPLLIIVDEGKTVPDRIFEAFDRCSYNAILVTSSPGYMRGRFYETQYKRKDFVAIQVGLNDCPHIDKSKIDRLHAQYGPNGVRPNPEFLLSVLEGKFMRLSAEGRFNAIGLAKLRKAADEWDIAWRRLYLANPAIASNSNIGELQSSPKSVKWYPDYDAGWLWIGEHPIYGCEYIGFCDPMTGEQSEGSDKRDTHGCGIIRKAYKDAKTGILHDDEVVAVMYAKEDGPRWDNDILAERFSHLLLYYGDCMGIVEANNAGTEVIRLLSLAGRNLYHRTRRDDVVPGRKLKIVGFQTNPATKNLWIGALGEAIREQCLVCNFPPAVDQMETFILDAKGRGGAMEGCFDDLVTGIGLGLFAKDEATLMIPTNVVTIGRDETQRGAWHW